MSHSSAPSATRVVFLQVRDNAAKIQWLTETAQSHFGKKEPLIIFVEDSRAQQFVDELLWKVPKASFLPHAATDEPTSDWIAICKVKKNVNNAKIAFNLCSIPLLLEGPFHFIYEFEDLTTPAKKNFSSLRLDAYKQAGYSIISR